MLGFCSLNVDWFAMNKKIIYVILALMLLLLVFLSVACTNSGYDYPKMIDDTREYESVAVTDEQKYSWYCRIEGYVSGDYKIVRVFLKGHVDEIELLVLIGYNFKIRGGN